MTRITPSVLRLAGRVKKISKNAKIKEQALDNLLDALVWMRRKAKRRKPIDDLIEVMIRVRRKAKKAAKKTGKQSPRRRPKKTK